MDTPEEKPEVAEETPEVVAEETPRFACTKCDYVANSERNLKSHFTKMHAAKKTKKRVSRRSPAPDKRAIAEIEKEKPKPITGRYVCTQKSYVWPRLYRIGRIAEFTEDHPAPQKDGKVIGFEKATPGVNYERPEIVRVKGVGSG